MSQPTPQDDRRRELLAERALFGLDEADQRELAALGSASADDQPNEYELAAAALDIALSTGDDEPLPAGLRERILATARPAAAAPAPTVNLPSAAPAPASRRREWLAWFAAAAAVLIAAWLGQRSGRLSGEPSPAELRQRLLALRSERPGDVVEAAWTRGEDPTAAAAEGDVIWSDREQAGVMRFRGLKPNDPAVEQYQLWIFDPTQDERYPVDGGVFDVPAGADEVLVPIDAKLRVAGPTLFAITVEKPGGVVVSDRSRLPLLAPIQR